MNKFKKLLILALVMAFAVYAVIVYAAAPNPGHVASEVGGDTAADRVFNDYGYMFPNVIGVGMSTTPAIGQIEVRSSDKNAIYVLATGTDDNAVEAWSSEGVGVFGISQKSSGAGQIGVKGVATSGSEGIGVSGAGTYCDFYAGQESTICFGTEGCTLYAEASATCSSGVTVATHNSKSLCFVCS